MKSHPGVAAKMFSVLNDESIEPQIVTTSPIKVACHVPREDVERAVRALHHAFEDCTGPTRSGRVSLDRARIGVVGATGAVGLVSCSNILSGAQLQRT